MNNKVISVEKRAILSLSQKGARLMTLSLMMVFSDAMLEVSGQADGRVTGTIVPNQLANMQTNSSLTTKQESKPTALRQRLGGGIAEVLLRNHFVEGENGILQRDRVTVGDLRKLLKYDDTDLDIAPSSSIGHPSYYVRFADVRCVVKVAEEHKSIHDDTTLLNVMINTNALPMHLLPMGTNFTKRGTTNKDKPSGNLQRN